MSAVFAAIPLHLNLPLTRRIFKNLLSAYLDQELIGRIDLGSVERLDAATVWLKNAAIYDELNREVLHVDELRVSARTFQALWDSFAKSDKLTIATDHVWASGVKARLHANSVDASPSLLRALELDPARSKANRSASARPYRIALTDVTLNHLKIQSDYPKIPVSSAAFRRVAGLVLITKDGVAVSLKEFALRAEATHQHSILGTASFDFRSPTRIWGQLNATLDSLPFVTRFDYRGDTLDLSLDAPQVSVAQARALLPDWPLQRDSSFSVSLRGPLTSLVTAVNIAVEKSQVSATGRTAFVPALSGHYQVTASGMDLGILGDNRFRSALALRATASFLMVGSQPEFRFNGEIDEGVILSQKSPSLVFDGQADTTGFLLGFHAKNPALPLRAAVLMKGSRIEFDAQANRFDLSPLARAANLQGINAELGLTAHALIENRRVDVEFSGSLKQPKWHEISAAQLGFRGQLSGPLDEPSQWQGEASINTKDLQTRQFGTKSLSVNLDGSQRLLHVRALAQHDKHHQSRASATLAFGAGYDIGNFELESTGGTNRFSIRVAKAQAAKGTLSLQGLNVTGTAGDLRGDLLLDQNGDIVAQISGDKLRLSTLNDFIKLPVGEVAGDVTLNLKLDTRSVVPSGTLQFAVARGSVGTLTNIEGVLEQTLDGNQLWGNADFKASSVERIKGKYELELKGPVHRVASYEGATSSGELSIEKLDLASIADRYLKPTTDYGGHGTLSARIVSDHSKDQGPNVLISVSVDGLGVSKRKKEGSDSIASGLQLLGTTSFDGNRAAIRGDWVLSKNQKPLALFGATAQGTTESISFASGNLLQFLRTLPFEAWLQLPRQDMSEFASTFGLDVGTGIIEGRSLLQGPLSNPHWVADFHAEGARLSALSNSLPLDLQGMVEFEPRSGETRVLGSVGSNGTTFAELNGMGSLSGTQNDDTHAEPNYDWQGQVSLGLTGLPLQAFQFAKTKNIEGLVRGGGTVVRKNGRTHISALIPIDGLTIEKRPVGQSLLSVRSDTKGLVTEAKLLDGSAQVQAEIHIPIDFTRSVPKLREDEAIRLAAQASGYDAGILNPWLGPEITGLQGELNGSIEAAYGPFSATAQAQSPRLALGGQAELQNGRVELRDMGIALSELNVKAQASSTASRTTIQIPKLQAAVGPKNARVRLSAALELVGLKLEHLRARVEEAAEVPLVIDGITYAALSGRGDIELLPPKPSEPTSSAVRELAVNIALDELTVALPHSQARSVVELAENPDIIVKQPLGASAFRKTQSVASTPMRLKIDLGKHARVTRSDFSIPVSGSPVLSVGETLRTTGTLKLEPMGRIQLFGKTFIVERGQVVLNPDEPQNPRFELVAQWRGPTHIIIATVSGNREEAELHLSSDPALPSESQVMAQLLSGSGSDTAATSATLGVGATLFNEFMAETPLSAVELRTSQDERHANYTAAVPIKDNLWFEGTYQSATSLRPNSTTSREGFSGTLDYRFRRNWSLRTELGTLGAGADLMWQYRY